MLVLLGWFISWVELFVDGSCARSIVPTKSYFWKNNSKTIYCANVLKLGCFPLNHTVEDNKYVSNFFKSKQKKISGSHF